MEGDVGIIDEGLEEKGYRKKLGYLFKLYEIESFPNSNQTTNNYPNDFSDVEMMFSAAVINELLLRKAIGSSKSSCSMLVLLGKKT